MAKWGISATGAIRTASSSITIISRRTTFTHSWQRGIVVRRFKFKVRRLIYEAACHIEVAYREMIVEVDREITLQPIRRRLGLEVVQQRRYLYQRFADLDL
jgi:hypothetical protein